MAFVDNRLGLKSLSSKEEGARKKGEVAWFNSSVGGKLSTSAYKHDDSLTCKLKHAHIYALHWPSSPGFNCQT